MPDRSGHSWKKGKHKIYYGKAPWQITELLYFPLCAFLFISNLCTAAWEHFNACQQCVQKTCCACKQTHTEALIYSPNPDQASSDRNYRQICFDLKLFLLFCTEQYTHTTQEEKEKHKIQG